ncbi:unnamed protein product [Lactuca virosa]|uniref:Uncharacterized protein n=1 Tax=Lactuca virosa TaxID=75947 RepID=A0AAU9NS60_9ASTR|nr:unnamed protein product [Lactuca virosa]
MLVDHISSARVAVKSYTILGTGNSSVQLIMNGHLLICFPFIEGSKGNVGDETLIMMLKQMGWDWMDLLYSMSIQTFRSLSSFGGAREGFVWCVFFNLLTPALHDWG